MANRYWVTGGDGNWNSTTNWSTASGGASGASVPGSADAALLDASSGAGTVTLDISPDIQALTCTGFTGTLAFGTNTISLNSTGTIFTGNTTMTVTGTPLIICTNATATARTITPGLVVTEANSISFRITAGTGTLSLTNGNMRDLDFTDGTNPTGFSGSLLSTTLNIYGNLKLSTGMTVTSGTPAVNFNATSGTKTINTAGVTFDRPFTFNGVGGTFQLVSALTSGATRTTTLTNGTLDLNGFVLTTGLFVTNTSNATTLAFGTGNITVSGTGTVFTGSTTCTVTGTPQVICTNATATARTISPGAVTEANSISFRITAGTGSFTITSSQNVKDLNFTDGVNPTGFAGPVVNTNNTIFGSFTVSTSGMSFVASGTYTFASTSGTKTINTAGVTIDKPFTFSGVGGTWQLQAALTSGATRSCTLTAGTLDLNNYTITIGGFSASNANTRTLAFGTGKLVLTTNNTTVSNTSTGTGLTVTGSKRVELYYTGSVGTRAILGATTSTVVEGVNLLDYYITAGSDIVQLSGVRTYGNLDFSDGGTSAFTGNWLNSTNTTTLYGSLILNTAMSVGGGAFTVSMRSTSGTKTITSAGKTLDFPVTFDGIGGTWTCTDALTLGSTQTLTLTNGTLQLKSGTTSTVGAFATSGTTQKYLQSSTAGTQATISDASGINTVSYLTIQDSYATGGADWDATQPTNINSGNNRGWYFPNSFFLLF